ADRCRTEVQGSQFDCGATMTPISYDARRSALYTPEQRETLFVAGQVYSELQLAIDGARLAYCRAETDGAQRQRLIAALERVAFAASLAAKRGVRIVDCCDAITDVPLPVFGYSHVGPASYLTRDGERVQNPDSAFIRADRLQGIAQYVAAHALEIDAVRLRELA